MGPAVESPEKIDELIAAGMNMARLNLSHGGYEEHQNRFDAVRASAKKSGKAVAILVDLQGPKQISSHSHLYVVRKILMMSMQSWMKLEFVVQ